MASDELAAVELEAVQSAAEQSAKSVDPFANISVRFCLHTFRLFS